MNVAQVVQRGSTEAEAGAEQVDDQGPSGHVGEDLRRVDEVRNVEVILAVVPLFHVILNIFKA